ncbi:hypothetical protein N7G274_002321 [Stereocaulon virgatum]|uniref:Uncharacterized protein n=1 Tax=Stereocaulon virgatum TaxID=373712 RepID=A0ABR4AHI0_9LECA
MSDALILESLSSGSRANNKANHQIHYKHPLTESRRQSSSFTFTSTPQAASDHTSRKPSSASKRDGLWPWGRRN